MWLHNLIHQTQKRQKPQTPFRGQRQESYRNIVYSGFAKSYLTYEQLQAYSKTLSDLWFQVAFNYHYSSIASKENRDT